MSDTAPPSARESARESLRDAPIGVFDSDIGGLSVLRALRAQLPAEHFVYLADSAHAHYGERGDAYVGARSLALARVLAHEHRAKALVVACNTATGAAIATLRQAYPGLPIVALAFILAAAVRVIQGSATVAMLTACGLVLPMLEPLGLNGAQLAAVTIAIGGGAIVLSHVNDSGFWLANRYLGLTEKQTLQTWTVMETIIGTTGGVMAMIIYSFL